MKYLTNYKNIAALFLLLLLGLMSSCEEHVIDDGTEPVVFVDCNPNLSFTTDIQPIIQDRCVSCHNGSQPPNLTSYSRISSNAQQIKSAVVSRRMPQGGSLPAEQIEMIRCWIDNGAQNN